MAKTHRPSLLALAGAVLLGALAASPASAQDGLQRWIDIVNRSGTTIERFYATDVGTTNWGPDLLGDGVVAPGRQVRVEPGSRQRGRGFCMFDLRVVFRDGSEVQRRRINLCEATAIVCTSTSSCGIRN